MNKLTLYTRRQFINAASMPTVLTMVGRPMRDFAQASGKVRTSKMVLSFYCDDTGPYVAGAKAFEIFLNYCAEHGIAGESSAILGASGKSMSRNPTDEEREYLRQVRRAVDCGIDTHSKFSSQFLISDENKMEIMTHHGLFDFDANCIPNDAVRNMAARTVCHRRGLPELLC